MQKISAIWRSVSLADLSEHIRRFPTAIRVGKNSAWLLLGRLVTQLQLIFLTILIARRLGETTFGQYALITSIVALGNVFTTFGTDTLLIRQIARTHQVDIPEIPAALLLQFALSIFYISGIWFWSAKITNFSPEFIEALRIYSFCLLPLALFSIYTALLRGFERMDLYLIAGLGTSVIQLVAIWVALVVSASLFVVMGVLLAVQVFSTLITYFLCRSRLPAFRIILRPSLSALLQLLKSAWPLALLSVLGVGYQRLGIFSLSILGNDAQIGLFSAASRLVEAIKLGHIALLGALLPALSGLYSVSGGQNLDQAGVGRLFRQAAISVLVLGIVEATGLAFLSHPLITQIFGSSFQSAVQALQVLAWVLVPYSASSVMTIDLIAKGKEKLVTGVLAISLAAGMAFNLVLVPKSGLQGACLASLGAECIQAVILGLYFLIIKNPVSLQ